MQLYAKYDELFKAQPAAQTAVPEGFDAWLKTVCFQKSTPEAYDLAQCAWNYLSAAPQPVAAQVDTEVLHALLEQMRGAHGAAMSVAYCPSSAPFKDAQKRFAQAYENLFKTIESIHPQATQPTPPDDRNWQLREGDQFSQQSGGGDE